MLSILTEGAQGYCCCSENGLEGKLAYTYDAATGVFKFTDQSTYPSGDDLQIIHIDVYDKFGGHKYAHIDAAAGSVYVDADAATGNGQVTGFTVTAGGSGFTGTPTVSFSGGGGSGLAAVAIVDAGAVTGIQIVNPGTGYTSAPTVTISGGSGTGATATATVALATPLSPALNVSKGFAISVTFVTENRLTKDGSVFLTPGIVANAGQFDVEQ
ncbi:MAG: hypothetical protein IPQ08_06370 [Chitinophagaceae bacterium]|nr:hypothetical protein [Chitinophagaceae bacterium]